MMAVTHDIIKQHWLHSYYLHIIWHYKILATQGIYYTNEIQLNLKQLCSFEVGSITWQFLAQDLKRKDIPMQGARVLYAAMAKDGTSYYYSRTAEKPGDSTGHPEAFAFSSVPYHGRRQLLSNEAKTWWRRVRSGAQKCSSSPDLQGQKKESHNKVRTCSKYDTNDKICSVSICRTSMTFGTL